MSKKSKKSKEEKVISEDDAPVTEKKVKKEKKEKKVKEKKLLKITSNKANPNSDIDPRTGTRFSPNSARQQAFDIIYEMAKDKQDAKAIRAKLKSARKDAGNKYNLDPGYLHYVVAMHPDMFEAYSDGEVRVVGKPKVDKEAAKKMEQEAEKKRERASAEREKRKAEKESGGEKTEKKKKKKKKDVEIKE